LRKAHRGRRRYKSFFSKSLGEGLVLPFVFRGRAWSEHVTSCAREEAKNFKRVSSLGRRATAKLTPPQELFLPFRQRAEEVPNPLSFVGFASVFQREWSLRRISGGCAQALGVKAVPKFLRWGSKRSRQKTLPHTHLTILKEKAVPSTAFLIYSFASKGPFFF